jgi:hypothetical protein
MSLRLSAMHQRLLKAAARRVHAPTRKTAVKMTALAVALSISFPPLAMAQQQIIPQAVAAPSTGQFQNIAPVAVDPKLQNLPDNRPQAVGGINAQVAHVRMEVDRNAVPADGQSPVNVKVTLFDKNDKPLDTRATITIEASGGRIHLLDRATDELGPAKGDLDHVTPGVQLEVAHGVAQFQLIAPSVPNDVALRVTVGSQEVTGRVSFVPELRPMLATGLIEGVASFSRNPDSGSSNSLFENELNNYHDTDGGKDQFGARSEFFLKGVIKGDYLLTMSYDSDKAGQSPLFRDIQPEEYYPVYGDASIKGFDAQTTQKLYVRIDKDHSFVMFGDFNTGTSTHDPAALGNYSRSLTGLDGHYETQTVIADAYASRTTSQQVVEEQPARGTSGPYYVTNLNGIRNSEKVEILTRDRSQPSVILSDQIMTRFVDYTFDPFSGQVLFMSPVPTLDANFNPLSIRITYEVDAGGSAYYVAGVDGQIKLTDQWSVGGSAAKDENPIAQYKLGSVNSSFKLDEHTSAMIEVAHSSLDRSEDASLISPEVPKQSGNAERIDLRESYGDFQGILTAGRSDVGFYNPTATLQGGREEISARASEQIDPDLKLSAELIKSEDRSSGAERTAGQVYGDYRLSEIFTLTVGLRRSEDKVGTLDGSPVGVNAYAAGISNTAIGETYTPVATNSGQLTNTPNLTNSTSVRARLTAKLGDKSSVYGEYERDISDADKQRYALGGDYQLFERTRIYAQEEWSNSSSGPYGLNDGARDALTTIGIANTYMKDGEIFSEYRLRDADDERDAQAAFGVRNLWNLADGVRVTAGFERQDTFSNSTTGMTTALPTTPSTVSASTPTSSTIAGSTILTTSTNGAPIVNGSSAINTIAAPVSAIGAATALTGGFELTYDPAWKAAGRLELRQDPDYNTVLSTLAYSSKINRDWTFIARNYLNYLDARTSLVANEYEERVQIGGAYRPVDDDRWAALGRYELRMDSNMTEPDPAREWAQIFSVQSTFHPSRPWWISGRAAAEWVYDDFSGVHSDYFAYLFGGRLVYDLSKRWDIGVTADVLFSPQGSAKQYSMGLEGGYLLQKNLWLSLGYNFAGFSDRDLTGTDYTNRGVYVRLRYKFDEDLFGANDPDVNHTLDPVAPQKP